jgi:hypothetical protein
MGDHELSVRLDVPGEWRVLDGSGHLLTRSLTLRHAIRQVRMIMSGGMLPMSLVRGSGRPVVVPTDQLYRMYARVLENDHLALAKTHFARGETVVARQRRVIERLRSGGHDTTEAERFLNLLSQALQVMRRHLRSIESEAASRDEQ